MKKKASKRISVRANARQQTIRPASVEQKRKLRDAAALELGRLVLSGAYTLVELDRGITPIADDAENVDGLVAAAVRVAEQRTGWLRRLRTAIQAQDREQTQMLAEMLCGLREEDSHEARNSASPRVH